jgi:hypothetical protein
VSVNVSPVSQQDLLTQPVVLEATGTAAWQARGGAHDRAVRRKMMIAAPVVAAGVVVLYALLLR